MSNDLLVWLVPAVFSICSIAYMAGRQTMALANQKAATIAIHRRLDEIEQEIVKLHNVINNLRDVLVAKGYVAPGTNPAA